MEQGILIAGVKVSNPSGSTDAENKGSFVPGGRDYVGLKRV